MADGEKILGVGPKMLVALVFSVLLVAIVVGKWGSVSGVSNGDVRIHFSRTDELPRTDPAQRPRLAEAPPTQPLQPEPANLPLPPPPADRPLQLDELQRIFVRDLNGEPQDPKDVERLLRQLQNEKL